MNKKLKVFNFNKNYYKFLIINQLEEFLLKQERPYIGFVVIKINSVKYAIPLLSDENNKYRNFHKYSFLIPDENGNKLGVLRINKMIPIIDNEHFIKPIDMNSLDYQDGIRLFKELEFINQPHIYDKVHQLANEIYEKRYNATQEELANDTNLKFAVDFKEAEILMYKYAFELYDKQLLDEEPLIPEYIANESLYEFSELEKYCDENNINDEDRHIIYESEVYQIELLRHNNGDLKLIEEIWDGTENDENGNTMYIRPFINGLNDICKRWTNQELKNMSKYELMEDIKHNLGWFERERLDTDEDELEEFYENLSEQLDEWDIDFVNRQNQVQ